MRIGDSLKKLLTHHSNPTAKTTKNKDDTTIVDLRKAECPYCQKALDKFPARKTKCPHCGEHMYVRTRPSDRARVVVTKAGADKIEEEWERKHYLDDFIARDPSRKDKFEKERERLANEFGKQPSDRDVMWRMLNQELGEHFRHRNFGLYRNTRLEMAEILKKEMKLEPAFKTYLEVCYLDLNGPNNLGEMPQDELLKKPPPFEPYQGFVAPEIGSEIREIMEELRFDRNKAKSIFVEHTSKVFKSWKLPLTLEACWSSLETEIENPSSPCDDRNAGQRED
jgi:hypothetical protein